MYKNKGICFVFPSFVGVFIFLLIPYLDVFKRAFVNGVTGEFVGLNNFKCIINNDAFRLAMTNSFNFVVICIPLLLVTSLLIAIFIYENQTIASIFKTGFLVPLAIPVASVTLVWKLIFDNKGLLNSFFYECGFETVDWMNSKGAFWILVFSYIWKNMGYNIILWIATLSTISPNIIEAAQIDGAGKLQCFRYIIVPNIIPGIFVIIILGLINSFKVFREAYLVAGDYPHESMYLMQHLFNNWFRDLAINDMAAGAVVNSIILISFILLLQRCWDRK